MKNLNNAEINAVSGGAEVRYCDIEKKGDPNVVYARLSFAADTKDDDKVYIYNLIKNELLSGFATKDLGTNTTISCYIFNQ